jgi:hypothetical protein
MQQHQNAKRRHGNQARGAFAEQTHQSALPVVPGAPVRRTLMTPPDGIFLRPPDPDDEDERRAAFDDELDLARLFEERVDALAGRCDASPFDGDVHDRASRDVYGIAEREQAHES